MAIYHCSCKIIGRSAGHSSVAAAAYRSGEKLVDERTGEVCDYTRKGGVEHQEIMLPENAPEEFTNRETLWNAVEKVEKGGRAQLAREYDIALPHELNRDEQIKMAREFIQENFVDKGMCADWALHAPDHKIKNEHIHVMLTTRPINDDGTWGAKAKNEYVLDKNGERILDKIDKNNRKIYKRRKIDTTNWNSNEFLEGVRENWAKIVNKELEKKGIDERIDHRSLKDQGIDRAAQKHMGKAATALERQGIATEIGDYNREIKGFEKDLANMKDILEVCIHTTQRQIDFIDRNEGMLSEEQLQQHQELLVVNMRGIDQFAESGLISEAEGANLRGRMAPLADELSMRLQISAEHLGMSLEASESVEQVDNQKRHAIDDLIQNAEGIQTKQRETVAAMEDFQRARIAEEEERLERILAGNMDAREQQRMADYYEWAADHVGIDLLNDDGTRKNTLQLAFECIVYATTGEQILTERQREQRKWLENQKNSLMEQSAEQREEVSKDMIQYIKAQNRTGWKGETRKSGSLRTAMDIAARYKLTTMEDIEEFLKRPDITPAQRRQIEFLLQQLEKSIEKDSKAKTGKKRTSPESFVPDGKNGTVGIPNLKLPAGGIIGALVKDIAKEGGNLLKQAVKEATKDDRSRER